MTYGDDIATHGGLGIGSGEDDGFEAADLYSDDEYDVEFSDEDDDDDTDFDEDEDDDDEDEDEEDGDDFDEDEDDLEEG